MSSTKSEPTPEDRDPRPAMIAAGHAVIYGNAVFTPDKGMQIQRNIDQIDEIRATIAEIDQRLVTYREMLVADQADAQVRRFFRMDEESQS